MTPIAVTGMDGRPMILGAFHAIRAMGTDVGDARSWDETVNSIVVFDGSDHEWGIRETVDEVANLLEARRITPEERK